MSALRRWWEWETRMFRTGEKGRPGQRPGQRAGLMVGLGIIVVGVLVTVIPLTTR